MELSGTKGCIMSSNILVIKHGADAMPAFLLLVARDRLQVLRLPRLAAALSSIPCGETPVATKNSKSKLAAFELAGCHDVEQPRQGCTDLPRPPPC